MEETMPILEQPEATPQIAAPKVKKGPKKIILILVVIIAVILVLTCLKLCLFYDWFFGLSGTKNTWKAVFLTNGQVYFGKIVKETPTVLVLREIYYLQVQQLAQEKEQAQQPQFTLIRLGEEIHGPTDEIRINREHVLFIETLKPNSKVVETIETQKK